MELSYLGAGGVRIVTKAATIVVDPGEEASELAVKADVVLLTQPRDLAQSGITFDSPGEYEVRGVMITGVATQLHADAEGLNGTAYAIHNDGINAVVTGNLAPGLAKEQIEALGKVDILMVPVGNHGLTLDAQAAAELVSLLEPAYVVPIHYNDGKTKYAVEQDTAEPFFKEIGASPEETNKLKVTGRDLPTETVPVYLTRA